MGAREQRAGLDDREEAELLADERETGGDLPEHRRLVAVGGRRGHPVKDGHGRRRHVAPPRRQPLGVDHVALVEQADDEPRELGAQHVVLTPGGVQQEHEVVEQGRAEPRDRPDDTEVIGPEGLARAEADERDQRSAQSAVDVPLAQDLQHERDHDVVGAGRRLRACPVEQSFNLAAGKARAAKQCERLRG